MNSLIENVMSDKTVDVIMAILLMISIYILSPFFAYIVVKIFNVKKRTKEIRNNTFYYPLKIFFRVTGIYISILFLKSAFNYTTDFTNMLNKIYRIIVIITFANSFANSITKKSKFIKRMQERSNKDINDNSVKMIVRIVRAIIYIVAVFIIFIEIGYDLSGLITGVGLGSIVLTLAAQDTLKNLLGGILIFMDKPFKVGDYIKILTYEGTVEDMTFRSTKIRTLDNSIVQIPNSIVSSDSIENLTSIKRRRYKLDLEVVLNTPIEQINTIKNEIMQLLNQNESIIQDTIHINFNEIGKNGLNIMILFYFNVFAYYEYLDLKEEVNKKIMNLLYENKIELAYDTKTIEIKK